jgi:hypothetical protein
MFWGSKNISRIIDFLDIKYLSDFSLKTTIGDWILSPSSGKILLSWAQPIEPDPISEHQNKHKTEYINQTQHNPSAGVKTNNTKLYTH